ncbi:hypothetical protein M3J09_000452 [Ascochyta lentis]
MTASEVCSESPCPLLPSTLIKSEMKQVPNFPAETPSDPTAAGLRVSHEYKAMVATVDAARKPSSLSHRGTDSCSASLQPRIAASTAHSPRDAIPATLRICYVLRPSCMISLTSTILPSMPHCLSLPSLDNSVLFSARQRSGIVHSS